MTKPTPPATGGSFTRESNGSLKQVVKPAAAPKKPAAKAPKKPAKGQET